MFNGFCQLLLILTNLEALRPPQSLPMGCCRVAQRREMEGAAAAFTASEGEPGPDFSCLSLGFDRPRASRRAPISPCSTHSSMNPTTSWSSRFVLSWTESHGTELDDPPQSKPEALPDTSAYSNN